MFEVFVTQKADNDMQRNTDWWREHRSASEAETWYDGILAAIKSLDHNPERCPYARENEHSERELKHLLYGVSTRPTHRVIFYIEGESVIICRVLHTSQE